MDAALYQILAFPFPASLYLYTLEGT